MWIIFRNELDGSIFSRKLPLAHFGSVSGWAILSHISIVFNRPNSPSGGSVSDETNLGPAEPPFLVIEAVSSISSPLISSNYVMSINSRRKYSSPAITFNLNIPFGTIKVDGSQILGGNHDPSCPLVQRHRKTIRTLRGNICSRQS